MKIVIKDIALEVTRKCNLKCQHCMRGDSQNIDIDYKYIDYILNKNHIIKRLFFSGGEPLLNKDAIIYAVNKIINEKLEVLSIGFNTNGTIYDEELIKSLLKYREFCLMSLNELYDENNSNLAVSITFSDDQYHDNKDSVIEKYKIYKDKINFRRTGTLDILDDEVLLSGRAKDIFFGRYFEFKNEPINIIKVDDNYILNNNFYITAKGDITTEGDGSYSDMDINNFGQLSENSFISFTQNNCEKDDNLILIKHI